MSLITYLAKNGVFPSFAFPINVAELHVLYNQFNQPKKQRHHNGERKWNLSLERDMKLAITEYAPGAEIDAAKRRFESVGFRKFPQQELDYNHWYCICRKCNNIHFLAASSIQEAGKELREKYNNKCDTCTESLQDAIVSRWLEPTWGFVTDRHEEPKPTGRKPPERFSTTDVYFEDTGRPLVDDRVFPPVDSPYQVKISSIRDGHGQLIVFNFGPYRGDDKQGFVICPDCGRDCGELGAKHQNPHRTKKANDCDYKKDGRMDYSSIGHKYETDIAWLEFSGTDASVEDKGFWMSLGYAIINAAAEVLNIESTNIGVTIKPFMKDGYPTQAIILYDTAPGGAGHCKQIAQHIHTILPKARETLENCDCPPERYPKHPERRACYKCLSEYRNARYHHLLSRGPVRRYLDKIMEANNTDPTPWCAPREAWWQRLIDDIQEYRGALTLMASKIDDQPLIDVSKDVLDLLRDFARVNSPQSVTICLSQIPSEKENPAEHHRLRSLKELGMVVKKITDPLPGHGCLILGTRTEPHRVWRWEFGTTLGNQTKPQTARPDHEKRAVDSLNLAKLKGGDYQFVYRPDARHFRVSAKSTKEMFARDTLGPIFLRSAPNRILFIDPYIASKNAEIAVFEEFINRPPYVIPKLLLVSNLANPQESWDWSPERQQKEINKVVRPRVRQFRQHLSTNRDELHDRDIWLEREDGKYYHVHFGLRLACFSQNTKKEYSGVVYFEVTPEEFNEEWDHWAAKAVNPS